MATNSSGSTIVCQLEYCSLISHPPWLQPDLVKHPHGTNKEQITNCKDQKVVVPLNSHKSRKRRHQGQRTLNKGEELQLEYHRKVCSFVTSCYIQLMEVAKKLEYFANIDASAPQAGTTAQESHVDFTALCNKIMEGNNLCSSAAAAVNGPTPLIWNVTETNEEDVDIVGMIVNNETNHEVHIRAFKESFLIPSNSSFLLSDIHEVHLLSEYSDMMSSLYDIIVIDPPWENRSAIRGKKYQWLNNEDLYQLPIPSLASDGCLVAVWVTNKQKLVQWVKDSLFPYWNIQYKGEWIWLKVTTSGDLVFDLDSPHKKPYEILLIGQVQHHSINGHTGEVYCEEAKKKRKIDNDESAFHDFNFSLPSTKYAKSKVLDSPPDSDYYKEPEILPAGSDSHSSIEPEILKTGSDSCYYKEPEISHYSKESEILVTGPDSYKGRGGICPSIPQQYLFMSIQSAIHSQKPYIGDILKQFTGINGESPAKCLELFARNLTPGWTSWGNEVLKFQAVKSVSQENH